MSEAPEEYRISVMPCPVPVIDLEKSLPWGCENCGHELGRWAIVKIGGKTMRRVVRGGISSPHDLVDCPACGWENRRHEVRVKGV